MSILKENLVNLSCGGSWKDEDVGGCGVLRGGQGAGRRVASEPLVRRELLVHHTKHLVMVAMTTTTKQQQQR